MKLPDGTKGKGEEEGKERGEEKKRRQRERERERERKNGPATGMWRDIRCSLRQRFQGASGSALQFNDSPSSRMFLGITPFV